VSSAAEPRQTLGRRNIPRGSKIGVGLAPRSRFNMVFGDFRKLWDLPRGGPWDLPAGRIAEFNRFLNGSVVIVTRRDDAVQTQISARSA
jgi:hypothetical protein